jgi:hypothetical protein
MRIVLRIVLEDLPEESVRENDIVHIFARGIVQHVFVNEEE